MQCEPLAIIDSQLEVNRKKNLDEILGGKVKKYTRTSGHTHTHTQQTERFPGYASIHKTFYVEPQRLHDYLPYTSLTVHTISTLNTIMPTQQFRTQFNNMIVARLRLAIKQLNNQNNSLIQLLQKVKTTLNNFILKGTRED